MAVITAFHHQDTTFSPRPAGDLQQTPRSCMLFRSGLRHLGMCAQCVMLRLACCLGIANGVRLCSKMICVVYLNTLGKQARVCGRVCWSLCLSLFLCGLLCGMLSLSHPSISPFLALSVAVSVAASLCHVYSISFIYHTFRIFTLYTTSSSCVAVLSAA